MRRISGTLVATLLCFYLLFSYRTSLGAGDRIGARGVAPVGVVPTSTAAARPVSSSAPAKVRRKSSRRLRHHTTSSPTGASPHSSPSAMTRVPATHRMVVNGAPISMQYGVVQVRIVAEGGKIVSATALSAPSSNGRDQAINGQAIPILDHEVVQTGSANVDAVSGATYTSNAYRQSVQAAIDAAHIKG